MTSAKSSALETRLEKWSKVQSFVEEASGAQNVCKIRIDVEDSQSDVTKKLTAIIQQLGIQISHKAGDEAVHVSKQGNPMMYNEEYLRQRVVLRADPRVQEAIRKIWNTDVSVMHS